MSENEGTIERVTRSKAKAETVENEFNSKEQVEFETKNIKMPNDSMEALVKLLSAKFESEVSGKGAEEGIPEFDGEKNVKCWFNNFEANAAAYNWSSMQKFVFAKNKITKTAKLFLEAVTVTNYEQLKRVLLEEFDVQYSSADVHEQLRKKKKKENETFSEFVIKMRHIATMGNIDDASLIRYIVDGVSGKNELKVGMYGAQNFKELKRQYEIFARLGEKQQEKRKVENNNNNNNNKKKHCFNCGSANHRRAECEAEGPKCFKCNKSGHISKNCSVQNNKTVALNSVRQNKNMYKAVLISEMPVLCLIDTGAEVSLMKKSVALQTNTAIENYNTCISGIGGKVKSVGLVHNEIVIDNIKIFHNFVVVPDDAITFQAIVGFDITSQFRYSSDENGYFFTSLIKEEDTWPNVMNVAIEEKSYEVPLKYEKQVNDLVNAYKPKEVSESLSPVTMKISLLNEAKIQHMPSRVTQKHREVIKNQIDEWLEKGIIRPSTSEYCSRVVVVAKKDGSSRICVDFRDLNKIVQKDRFPVPLMEEVIDEMKDATIFSTIDLENAFFHVSIDEDSKKYTAFITREGLYEFNKAPFGFCNSPAVFLRLVNYIFRSLVNTSIMQIYMDDIIICSKTEDEGLEKLKKVLDLAADFGLNIKWKKCKFLQRKITFLGLKLESGTISPDDEKLAAISRFPIPKNVKDVQSFLGLSGFFRKFVKNYAIMAEPLTALLKKDVPFVMSERQLTAITEIKYVLTNQPILKIFCPTAETELHCDASKEGFGAILLQKFEVNWHPIYYWSKKCSNEDKKRHSYFLEIKAAYLAVQRLKHYLWGRKFKIITDCEAFKSTVNKQDLVPAVSRYILYLQDFQYTIEHRKGTSMRHADALSRYPVVLPITSNVSIRLKKAQEEDEYIKALIKIASTEQYENYKVIGNILYKQHKGLNLIVIPKRMENEVIRTMHEKGHMAAEKTQQSIEQEYFIPHLRGKIQKVIQSCVKCILHNKQLGKKEGFLNPIEKGDRPLADIYIDHLGPMDSTSKLYRYILTVVDGFTKFVWIYPTKTTTADEAIRRLKEWTKNYGAPERIISDQGAAFTSNIFKEWCTEEHIEQVLTTTGIARGNGQAERMNRLILNIISKLSSEKPEAWFKHVDKTQRAINSTINKTTRFSPFELMFGVKMKNELDFVLNKFLQEELLDDFLNERDENRVIAKKQILEAQKQYKRQYDKKRKNEHVSNIGDLVAIKRTQFVAGKKLASEFIGPYEITKCKRNGRYEVKKVGEFEGPCRTSTSCDCMKPWASLNEESDLSETED